MNIDNLNIGKTSEIVNFRSSDQHREATIRLIEQATRSIKIHSYDLEPKIYNNRRLVSALRTFVASDRHNTVEILIHDSKNLVLHGHQLVEMARQFSSFVKIKKAPRDAGIMSQTYIIADDTGVVQQYESKRFEGSANFNDRSLCKKLSANFSSTWLHADTAPELRQLHL
ncbi:MAG: hypothetical protein ACC707_09150 [Thiohalomonadales bacterium]